MTLLERLLANSIPEPNSGCLLWMGYVHPDTGYGIITHKGYTYGVHQASWITQRGPLKTGICVCHSCDTRICIEVNHLWPGTKGDNNRDAAAKGRSGGIVRPNTTLNDDLVRQIRASDLSTKALAEKYGQGYHTIWNIQNFRSWRHVK